MPLMLSMLMKITFMMIGTSLTTYRMPVAWTPPQTLAFPPQTEEPASFVIVIRSAAEVLDLTLHTTEVKTNVLTEVLNPGQSS